MEHTGEIWQDFIRHRIAPAQLTTLSPELAAISTFREASGQARDEFADRLMAEITGLQNEEQLKLLVYGYQTQLCFLINKVFGYWLQLANQSEAVQLYESVLHDLEENLNFLQRYFPRYFDEQSLVPQPLLRTIQNAVSEGESQIIQLREAIDPALCRQIFSALHSLAGATVSFGQLSYINRMLEELVLVATSPLPVPYGTCLMEWCILRNFNAPVIVEMMVGRIAEQLHPLESEGERQQWLTRYQKYLYQLPVDAEGGLLVHLLSVREQLLHWVELEAEAVPAVQKKETESAPPAAKLNTSVSVPVLALLTRAFKEAGIITNSNLQEIFRFMSTHYTSQRKESISAGNFHGKYYNVDESTKRKVSDLLLELVKVVKRMP